MLVTYMAPMCLRSACVRGLLYMLLLLLDQAVLWSLRTVRTVNRLIVSKTILIIKLDSGNLITSFRFSMATYATLIFATVLAIATLSSAQRPGPCFSPALWEGFVFLVRAAFHLSAAFILCSIIQIV